MGGTEDIELDDGHVYVANFYYTPADAAAGKGTPPGTGDEVDFCVLTASDGSKHYAFPHYKGQHYVLKLVR